MGYTKKLSDEQRMLVLKMKSEGMSPTEISKYISQNWGFEFTNVGVDAVCRAKKSQIPLQRFRDDYLKRIKEVPIANKRIRVDDFEYVRKKLLSQLKDNDCSTRAQRDEFRSTVKSLNEVMASVREEMERKPQLIPTIGVFGDLSDQTDDDLRDRKEELIKQVERSLTRGAPGAKDDSGGAQGEDTFKSS